MAEVKLPTQQIHQIVKAIILRPNRAAAFQPIRHRFTRRLVIDPEYSARRRAERHVFKQIENTIVAPAVPDEDKRTFGRQSPQTVLNIRPQQAAVPIKVFRTQVRVAIQLDDGRSRIADLDMPIKRLVRQDLRLALRIKIQRISGQIVKVGGDDGVTPVSPTLVGQQLRERGIAKAGLTICGQRFLFALLLLVRVEQRLMHLNIRCRRIIAVKGREAGFGPFLQIILVPGLQILQFADPTLCQRPRILNPRANRTPGTQKPDDLAVVRNNTVFQTPHKLRRRNSSHCRHANAPRVPAHNILLRTSGVIPIFAESLLS